MDYTFKKGVHPSSKKSASKNKPIEVMNAPQKVSIALAQHIGKPAVAIVNVGDVVKKGQLIATADGFVSANIFSSVSGTVESISEMRPTPMGKCAHIVIANDGNEDSVSLEPLQNPTKEQIVARIKDAGIVGMGGAGFPTHVKLSPKDPIDTLIINAAECEPYITCDHRIMLEYTEQFVQGARLLKDALGLDKVYIGVETNKMDAISCIKAYAQENNLSDVIVVPLKPKYPQGAEKQLIYAITKRKVPAGGLPSAVGCVVDNVHTALSTYYAVVEGKPLYERIMTVTGEGIQEPKNLLVRNGTIYDEVLAYCGGFSSDNVVKLISGGPMMGISVMNGECATTKTTSCLLALTPSNANLLDPTECINCSKCAQVCPMNLMPMFIDNALAAGDIDTTIKYGVLSCIECGCCAFICPAARPLVQTMKLAKKKIKERN